MGRHVGEFVHMSASVFNTYIHACAFATWRKDKNTDISTLDGAPYRK